ncbi:MAG: pyridoxal phosphate-dependent aminotransferase [Ruminococcaceae bacterium]|nr:pyridoxal phosphate-dependent aminotransferase [Oscillospiraceae bacterium]
MLNEKMLGLGENRSVIREIFEFGNKRRAEVGAQNVYDFSLGNPSIPAPKEVNEAMVKLLTEFDPVKLHGYTSAQGAPDVRKTIAQSIEKRFGIEADMDLIYMTCGAAASLTICLNAICNNGDEVIALAPFFPEYRVFVEKAGAKLVVSKCRESDFQIDFMQLEKAITKDTKAIIVNSPNNPTGVVLSSDTIKQLAKLLEQKQKEYGKRIFIICDEPYRELAYDVEVPYIPNYYDNTLVCYSYSKSLSLPGERIGYIFVSPKIEKCQKVYAAVCGAGRALGFVCAPSLLQLTVKDCVELTSDVSVYKKNRDLLYNSLTEYGYKAAKPDGAFYLFIKSPEPDANAFCERAKKYDLLLVPSDSFGYEGYVRISYCVSTEQIEKSLPYFKKLIEEYK